MKIRKADRAKDYEKIWDIFSNVIKTGDTYVFDPHTPKEALDKHWFADYMDTFVAVDDEDSVCGTYIIKPNQIDLGNHIANCGYMVNPNFQGRGIGKLLCAHSIEFAKQKGYVGIQFNIVVSTNTNAVNLWKQFGFEIIGTTPKGFRHKDLGLVDTYIMFKDLSADQSRL
jgi:L-amino acid N-acyltransferase YncA